MNPRTIAVSLGISLALAAASCSSSGSGATASAPASAATAAPATAAPTTAAPTTAAPTTAAPTTAAPTTAAPTTAAPTTSSGPASTSAGRFVFPEAASQALLDQLVASSGAPGAIMAVSVHGGPPTILTSGVSDIGTKQPMKPTDIMPIASVSKTFVGALLLLLVNDGKVTLDAPISTYGIDIPNAKSITVRELLSHTSGLPPLGGDSGRPDPYSLAWQNKLLSDLKHHFTLDEVIAYVRDRPLLFTPGSSTAYSNVNTVLAAKIVENVTGQTWTAALHEQILTPLKLTTVFDPGNEVPAVPSMQGLFVLEGNPTVLNTGDFDHMSTVSGLGPAGALVAGAADLVTWGNALLRDDTVLGPDLSKQAHEIGAGGTGLGVLGYDGSGYCVFYGCAPGTTFSGIGGPGSLPGGRTFVLYHSTTDSVLVVFANRTPANIEDVVAPELRLIADAEKTAT